jgi:hypothetical protein
MKVKLRPELIKRISSMNVYWEELKDRVDYFTPAKHEFQQLLTLLSPMEILLIVGEYVSNHENKA